jgi:hypothetical protein
MIVQSERKAVYKAQYIYMFKHAVSSCPSFVRCAHTMANPHRDYIALWTHSPVLAVVSRLLSKNSSNVQSQFDEIIRCMTILVVV